MQKIILILISIFLYLPNYSYGKNEVFRTLRYDMVNLRQGPGKDYPIKIFYKKKFLPVLILDSSDNFRKIRDHEDNSGWIHLSQLTKKKAAIVTGIDLIMFKNATIYSNPVAILKKGRLVKVHKCKNSWCKVKSGGIRGWVKKDKLWGLI
jgi:SH3-like domain-containing protein